MNRLSVSTALDADVGLDASVEEDQSVPDLRPSSGDRILLRHRGHTQHSNRKTRHSRSASTTPPPEVLPQYHFPNIGLKSISDGNLQAVSNIDVSHANYLKEEHINSKVSSPTADSGSNRSSRRISATVVPRPSAPQVEGLFYTTSKTSRCAAFPPPTNTVYTTIDDGISSPRFMRSTCYAVPSSSSLAADVGLPFAILATPFAATELGEDRIPMVDYCDIQKSIQGPPRCSRCRAFVNPGVVFVDNGRKWTCNLCNNSNLTPDW